jgi:hypothetical protein
MPQRMRDRAADKVILSRPRVSRVIHTLACLCRDVTQSVQFRHPLSLSRQENLYTDLVVPPLDQLPPEHDIAPTLSEASKDRRNE